MSKPYQRHCQGTYHAGSDNGGKKGNDKTPVGTVYEKQYEKCEETRCHERCLRPALPGADARAPGPSSLLPSSSDLRCYGDTHAHPNSTFQYTTESLLYLINFDANTQVELITQPLLMISGEKSDTRCG